MNISDFCIPLALFPYPSFLNATFVQFRYSFLILESHEAKNHSG